MDYKGFQSKLVIIDPKKYDNVRWSVNESSVDKVHKRYDALRRKQGDSYYLAGYMARRMQQYIAVKEYVENISKLLKSEIIYPHQYKLMELDRFRKKGIVRCTSKISILTAIAVALPFIITREILRHVNFGIRNYIIKADLCVDATMGPSINKDGEPTLGRYADTFLVEKEGKFALSNHAFIDTSLRKDAAQKWRSFANHNDVNLITLGRASIKITPLVFAKIIYLNYLRWMRVVFSEEFSVSRWSIYETWLHLLFQVELVRAQIIFQAINTKIYLSRYDYSPMHHVYGAECSRRGVKSIGLCHSPSGGVGYSPNMAIISFDEYFIYSRVFSERFFPSWTKWYKGTLHEIGVWRSSFILDWKHSALYEDHVKKLRSSLGNRFTVGVHLPVPDTFLFDEKTTLRWMTTFRRIVDKMNDTGFIFFPRRLSSKVDKFNTLVQDLKVPGRSGLSNDINPNWDQSYPWLGVCDLMVGCNYSDVTLESISCGVPAVSYNVTGYSSSIRSKNYPKFQVYSEDELIEVIRTNRDGTWMSKEEFQSLRHELVGGIYCGHINHIKNVLMRFL